MLEDLEGISECTKLTDTTKDSLSAAEVSYVNECVEGENPSALIDRIDELSPVQPPKGIDNTAELAEIIEPIKDQIDSKYLEAPADLEQIGQIGDYLASVENLDFENWKELSSAQRLDVLQEAEINIAQIEHRNPCNIHVAVLADGHHGFYNPDDKSITISLNDLSGSDFNSYKEVLDTLIHEGRHAYQDYNMAEREVHPRSGEVANWKWNEYELGYQSPLLCGFEAYQMQPVEADAKAFAADVINGFFNNVA